MTLTPTELMWVGNIPKQGKLVRVKIVPHLVFVNPPASPDGEQPPHGYHKRRSPALSPLWEKEASHPQNQLVTVGGPKPQGKTKLSPHPSGTTGDGPIQTKEGHRP